MNKSLRNKLHEVIFEADTKSGKAFDVILLFMIVASVIVVMLESVASIRNEYGQLFFILEWVFTIVFTIEYILRIATIGKPAKYAGSFFGIIDLLAIAPTYLSLIIPGSHVLIVIRILRVLRIFRILKFAHYISSSKYLITAMKQSRRKITVFLFAVFTLVIILGSLMYLIEGEKNGFTSIPLSIYWAIVTLTTVGYGDISPQTGIGQFFSSMVMILGYSIIAVPTGIVSAEMASMRKDEVTTQVCPECSAEGHDTDAVYCKYCSAKLN